MNSKVVNVKLKLLKVLAPFSTFELLAQVSLLLLLLP